MCEVSASQEAGKVDDVELCEEKTSPSAGTGRRLVELGVAEVLS